jgi:hypothetical protein
MNAVMRRVGLVVSVVVTVAAPHPGWAERAQGVSPGFVERLAAIDSRCPTFSWQEMPEAASYELVAYALPEDVEPAAVTSAELVGDTQVLYARVPGGATSWTPALDQCLAPGGSYVWFVRAVFDDEAGEEVPGDWSDGLFFAVSAVPSSEEVAEALRVLRRYVGDDATVLDEPDGVTTPGSPTVSRAAPTHPSPSPKAVPSAKTAIRGALSDPSGEAYGVVGVVSSPEGAGLGAANLAGGPDLVLDGSSSGEADTFLTQSSLSRPSDGDELFALFNPGAGTLSLEVEGVLFGNGSGLIDVNAAALGGLGPAGWANKEELATAGAIPVHWDNLTDIPPDLADGDQDTVYTAGPGLVLDGSELSAVWPGTKWGRHVVSAIEVDVIVSAHTSITVGSDGLGLVTYRSESALALKAAHCRDIACSTATVSTVDFDPGGDVGADPSITIGSDGLGLIAYRDAANADLKVAHCDDVLCSSATISTLDSGGSVGWYPSVAVGRDGLGLISYYNYTTGDVKVAHCDNVVCSSATATTIDSTGNVGWNTSITIGSDGLGLISYYDVGNGDLKVAHCDNVVCSSATATTIDSTGNVGEKTSITIGSDGLALISYYDVGNGDLKVAHCDNVVCSSATATTIDSAGNVGWHTSITIGSDGLGLISYYRVDEENLKVAHCSDIACTSARPIGVEAEGHVGSGSSVAIGVDGLPLISYVDYTNHDLKVTHCSNRFCIPQVRYR